MIKRSIALAFFALVFAGSAIAATTQPIVVESYTSQSCGPCVAADKILNVLADKPGIIALTFAVNYWDILGWKDTLASDATTLRQKAYARKDNKGGVYTPQMYVNGKYEVVGNNPAAVYAALERARRENASVRTPLQIGLSVTQQGLFRIALLPQTPQKKYTQADVWLLSVRSLASVDVRGGENGGKTLHYRNVVEDVVSVGRWSGRKTRLTFPRAGLKTSPDSNYVVLVQEGGYGPILNAAYFDSSRKYARRP